MHARWRSSSIFTVRVAVCRCTRRPSTSTVGNATDIGRAVANRLAAMKTPRWPGRPSSTDRVATVPNGELPGRGDGAVADEAVQADQFGVHRRGGQLGSEFGDGERTEACSAAQIGQPVSSTRSLIGQRPVHEVEVQVVVVDADRSLDRGDRGVEHPPSEAERKPADIENARARSLRVRVSGACEVADGSAGRRGQG